MRNLFWGIILVVFGSLLLLNNLGIADFEDVIRDYWPILLILWGVLVLGKRRKEHEHPATPSSPPVETPSTSQQIEGELVHDSNVFGDVWLNISSQNFKGGSASTIFGNCTINLSQASIAEGDHVLRVHSVFGSTSIILPKDAAVSVSASSTFGSVTVFDQHKKGISSDLRTATPSYESSTRRLKISITEIFGEARVY